MLRFLAALALIPFAVAGILVLLFLVGLFTL
jgi:hypothetical protein